MTQTLGNKRYRLRYGWTGVIIVVFILLITVFFYLDRQNEISVIIRAWGLWGIIFGILLIAALCMTPIPSEGLVVLYLKIHGIYQGIFYSWLGSLLGATAIFIIVRVHGQTLMKKLISSERIIVVDNWVKRKGSLGLLMARLLPIPAFAVNYIAAAMPSMKFWTYLWTAALSMIPYYIATSFVFLGVARETWVWLFLGIVALILFWGIGYLLNKRPIK